MSWMISVASPHASTSAHGAARRTAQRSVRATVATRAKLAMERSCCTDPKLALQIYAQALRRDEGEIERLRALVEGLGTGPVLVPETPGIASNPIPAS